MYKIQLLTHPLRVRLLLPLLPVHLGQLPTSLSKRITSSLRSLNTEPCLIATLPLALLEHQVPVGLGDRDASSSHCSKSTAQPSRFQRLGFQFLLSANFFRVTHQSHLYQLVLGSTQPLLVPHKSKTIRLQLLDPLFPLPPEYLLRLAILLGPQLLSAVSESIITSAARPTLSTHTQTTATHEIFVRLALSSGISPPVGSVISPVPGGKILSSSSPLPCPWLPFPPCPCSCPCAPCACCPCPCPCWPSSSNS